jgi:hypothetical protein
MMTPERNKAMAKTLTVREVHRTRLASWGLDTAVNYAKGLKHIPAEGDADSPISPEDAEKLVQHLGKVRSTDWGPSVQ